MTCKCQKMEFECQQGRLCPERKPVSSLSVLQVLAVFMAALHWFFFDDPIEDE